METELNWEIPENARKRILDTADKAVNGDRNVDYGDPTADFARTARYWNEHLCAIAERALKNHPEQLEPMMDLLVALIGPEDIAIMMMLLKVSRLSWTPEKADHWVDVAGYAACGAECVDRSYRYKGGLRW